MRRMVVLEPLKIVIENYPYEGPRKVSVPNFPSKPELGNHDVTFDRIIYIERTDFLEEGDSTYHRLTRKQPVGLRHAGFVLEVTDATTNDSGEVTEVTCKCTEVEKSPVKPKAFIHWVSDPVDVEIRLYSSLFKHKNPEDPNEVPGGFLTDCNLDSLKILKSFADKSINTAKVFDKFQFERIGYFSVDPDSDKNKLVLNQTVGLREDARK